MSTEFSFQLPDKTKIKVLLPVMSGNTKVFVNDQPAEQLKDKKEKPFRIHLSDGSTKEMVLKRNSWSDIFPKAIIDGTSYELGKKLAWYEYIAGGLPFFLVAQGGVIGAVIGLYSIYYNYGVLRSDQPKGKKALSVFASTALAYAVTFTIAIVVYMMVYGSAETK